MSRVSSGSHVAVKALTARARGISNGTMTPLQLMTMACLGDVFSYDKRFPAYLLISGRLEKEKSVSSLKASSVFFYEESPLSRYRRYLLSSP